jgi:flagellar hook-basal body complex protein FliE
MASYPWNQAVTFKPGFAVPAFVGTDFVTGKRDVNLGDFANIFQNAPTVFSGNPLPANYAAPEAPSAYPAGNPLGNLSQSYRELLDYQKARMPLDLEYQQQVSDITANQQNKQLASLYPYLSQAGTEATQRALAASKAYRAFAEGLPSNVQNIMASKQNQAYSAAQGEAARAQAMALQQQAANQSFGAFRGREISFG